MDEHCVIFITAGSKEEAEKLSRGLVEEKFAFCVNTVPGIQSTYFWEGKVHVDDEILLIVKTFVSFSTSINPIAVGGAYCT